MSFSVASSTLRWLKSQEEAKEDADLCGVARRDSQNYFVAKKPNRPEAHARGTSAIASSWIAELIAGPGIDSDITGFAPEDENLIFERVADEFHAAEREMAPEAGNITTDCGAMPCDMPTNARGDGEFRLNA